MTKQQFARFNWIERLEHWVMSLSFTILVVTGLPQRYAQDNWADTMITMMGGIEPVRIVHRVAAVIFILVMIYHFAEVAYKVFVLRVPWTMMLGWGDAKDLVNSVRYYLGLSEEHPKMPRYNFAEKIEYWAVIWGGVLMTITGFMLWNPIASTTLFPGELIPAARAAHSAEALLAFLAIIIWHVYWVHLKTFNRSMFNGKLTREQMELEHAAELEAIEKGQIWSPPPSEVQFQRTRVFMSVSSIVILLILVGLYNFVTFERTAITTIPPAEQEQAFIPATPTSTPTPLPTATPTPTPPNGEALPVSVPAISHTLGGREDCAECHAPDGPFPNPEDHAEYDLSTCQICHDTDSESDGPAVISHKMEGRERCSKCHEPDVLPESHQTANFSDAECLLCHEPETEAVASSE